MSTTAMSLDECREHIADYLNGKLPDGLRERFELGRTMHPELDAEIARARTLHSVLKQYDVNGMMDHRARNVSVRVQSSLRKPSPRVSRHLGVWTSAVAVAVVVGVMFLPRQEVNPSSEAFDQELEHLLQSSSGDSFAHGALPPADLGAGEYEYAVAGVPVTPGAEMTHLQDIADGLVLASVGPELSAEQRAVESLELLVGEELVEVDILLKEFEDVSSL